MKFTIRECTQHFHSFEDPTCIRRMEPLMILCHYSQNPFFLDLTLDKDGIDAGYSIFTSTK